jgi:endoglycosylceramidase
MTRLLWPIPAACLLAMVLQGCGGGSKAESDPGTSGPGNSDAQLGWLRAQNGRILDEQDRSVILRGLNHIGLRSDRNHPPYRDEDGQLTPLSELFEFQDLQDEDFAAIASMGFNVLRLVVTWEFAQPDPPPAPYNEAYFELIDAFIARSKAHGLYVIFDFGQFGWGRASGGNAGAPGWTISPTCASLPGPSGNAPPQASASVGCNYYNFWQNTQNNGAGLQDHYVALWQFVAARYRHEPAIAMYDLYNEPFGGPIPPGVFELNFLFPFYQRLAAAIREIDARHAVAFQPQLLHSIGVPTPIAIPIGIENAIYIPHEYTASYFAQRVDPAYTPLQDAITRLYLGIASLEAQIFGTPWLIGETGWTRSTHADGVGGPIETVNEEAPRQFARDFTQAADEQQLGWQWFAYSSIDEAYGINHGDSLDEPLIRALARPFPRATAGTLASFSFDPDSKSYRQTWSENPGGNHDIALPITWNFPDGVCISVDGATLGEVTGSGVTVDAGLGFDSVRQTLIYTGEASELVIVPGRCG